MKVRQKPIEVDAWRVSDICSLHVQDMPAIIKRAVNETRLQLGSVSITCITNGHVLLAQPTDWLIRGVGGEFFPCSDIAFSVYYQEIT